MKQPPTQPRAHTRRTGTFFRRCALSLLPLSTACQDVRPSGQAEQLPACETIQVPAVALRSSTPSMADQLALRRAKFEVFPWGLAFAANIDNEVLLLDSTFQQVRRLGRAGGGPGDLSGPVAVRASGANLAVMEVGNGRVSFWTVNGEYLSSFSLASTAAEFGVDSSRVVITPSGIREAYASRTDPSGTRTLIGRRSTQGWSSTPSYLLDMAARLPNGTVFIFDNTTQEIARLSANGDTVSLLRLPTSLERAIARSRDESDRMFRDMGISKSLAGSLREFRSTDDGRLFVRPLGEAMLGLLIDPEARRCTELLAPIDSGARAAMLGAYSMTVAQQRLYVVSAAGEVAVYTLPATTNSESATSTM